MPFGTAAVLCLRHDQPGPRRGLPDLPPPSRRRNTGGGVVSRRLWRCRNPECGAVLGRLTGDGGLRLAPGVRLARAYLDTRKAVIACPACGAAREFRGPAVVSSPGG